MEMADELAKKQQKMHQDFFVTCQKAIDEGFYLEALVLEYASLEGRLEVLLGLLNRPCNKDADDKIRQSVQISHRIHCLNYYRKHSQAFDNTKLDKDFFCSKYLDGWRSDRNIYIHALYKNANLYNERRQECEKLARDGLLYCRLLYNEIKRLRRLKKTHPDQMDTSCLSCRNKKCKANPAYQNEE